MRNYKIVIIFALSLRQELFKMIDDRDELKARVESLIDDVSYYLRHYSRLIKNGYRKSVLDSEIQLLINEIKWLSEEI